MSAKLLFVDDEPDIQELIRQKFRKQLRQGQYQFIFALNGIEALEKISEHTDLDLVITDMNMPGMDGLTLLSKLKELNPTFKTIVISAGGMENIQKAMNAGAFDFLVKPINLQDLELTIKKTLEFVYQNQTNKQKLQQAEEQLIQSEKMSALGLLVASVAHEINNPVGYISINLKYAAEYVTNILQLLNLYQKEFPYPGEKIEKKIHEIELEYLIEDLPKIFASMQHGTECIRDLSSSLRMFARSDTQTKIAFNLHEGIDNTLLILKHRLKANEHRPMIEVIRDYGELPLVECYPGQLNQVLMNLLSNAIDALEESNHNLSFSEIQMNPNRISISTHLSEDQNWALIHIQDNGVGIPSEAMEKIFEHLFTSKPVGQGTGLGLSISRQIIVEKHGGKLWCKSDPGKVTEFVIELPI
ncbi:response regulator [Nostoc sp. KVJ3]|nr:response regulator [Nostoc sp. KVJ3]